MKAPAFPLRERDARERSTRTKHAESVLNRGKESNQNDDYQARKRRRRRRRRSWQQHELHRFFFVAKGFFCFFCFFDQKSREERETIPWHAFSPLSNPFPSPAIASSRIREHLVFYILCSRGGKRTRDVPVYLHETRKGFESSADRNLLALELFPPRKLQRFFFLFPLFRRSFSHSSPPPRSPPPSPPTNKTLETRISRRCLFDL